MLPGSAIAGDMLYIQPPEAKSVDEHYEQLFHAYFQKLHAYAFTIVKEDAVAKDIVQHAFIRLWEKRNTIRIETAAKSYLYTSVYRLALNEVRNRKVRSTHLASTATDEFIVENFPEQKEIQVRIREAIHALPPRCKEIFCKSRFEEKKYAQIASELNISIKTVEVQVGKALKLLKRALSDLIIYLLYFSTVVLS